MTEEKPVVDTTSRAWLYCFVAVVFAVSLIGFLRGTDIKDDELKRPVPQHTETVENGTIPQARSYTEMRNRPPGKGSGWERSKELVTPKEKPAKLPFDAAALDAALKKRATARAYDGAPPTIPHHFRQNSAAECMACHGEGLRIGSLQAQTLPHDDFVNCTQCHVAADASMPGSENVPPDPRAVANSFQGVESPKRGARAWLIAPPQTPHSTFMRENCMSCHGPGGSSAMRSTHTDRQSCTQCHASSAELDLRPGLEYHP
jgi:cytochrome c-type protein NapB